MHSRHRALTLIDLLIVIVILVILGAILFPVFARPPARPPWPVQHRRQQQLVQSRAMLAGGWPILQKECEALCHKYPNGFSLPYNSSQFSVALQTLKPRQVQTITYGIANVPDGAQVVEISMFGGHNTGYDIPYYNLLVVCGKSAPAYVPKLEDVSRKWLLPTTIGKIDKIQNGIYEVY